MAADNLEWDEAERRWPGCSAEWDVFAARFRGQWQIEAFYMNYYNQPVVFVTGDDPRGLHPDDPRYHHAYFVYNPTAGRWCSN